MEAKSAQSQADYDLSGAIEYKSGRISVIRFHLVDNDSDTIVWSDH